MQGVWINDARQSSPSACKVNVHVHDGVRLAGVRVSADEEVLALGGCVDLFGTDLYTHIF